MSYDTESDSSTDANTAANDEWPVSDPVGHDDLLPLDMANNIDDQRVRERITWVDGLGRAYADALDDDPELVADGGLYTVDHDGTAYAVCHMVAYDEDADLDIDYSGEDAVVTNHDEVPKHDEVRLLKVESLREHGGEHMAISPASSLWRESFHDLEPGETIRLDDEQTMTDGGGTAWYDLTAFQRDILVIVAEAESELGHPPYGLAIKSALEDRYNEEVNHGRLYPNLDQVVEAGLLDKQSRDRRTNEYGLSPRGRSLLRTEKESWSNLGVPQATAADGGYR